VCDYVADFAYCEAGKDELIYEDAKGVRTALYKLKLRLVYACTGISVREV
jgi:hypothetical protein